MNILQVSTFDSKGGAAKIAFELHKKLREKGHAVSMFVHRKQSTDPDIFSIPQTQIERIAARIFATDITFWKSDYILKTPQYKSADIIHLHNIHGDYFALKTFKKMAREKKLVWTLHDMWGLTGHNAWGYDISLPKKQKTSKHIPSIEVKPPLRWNNRFFLYKLKQWCYEKTHFTVIPVSYWLADEAKQGILQHQKIQVIHNGIDANIFTPQEKISVRRELNLPINKKIVMFASVGGSQNIQKGWQYTEAVIRHFAQNENILFVCIGGAEPSNPEPNVLYVNYISDPKQMAKYYSAADIFLFSSIAENFPLVTLEAMSCGTAVVAFDVGGTTEAVKHKVNGYIAEYKNTDDLITGVKTILTLSKDSADQMSKTNTQTVLEHFTNNHMVDHYLSLYKTLHRDEI